MQDVGAYIWKRPGARKRLVCVSPDLQSHVWPYLFTRLTPGAHSMCQWASRNGAKLHPTLRIVHCGRKGFGVIVRRSLPAGTPVISVPTRMTLTTSNEDRQTLFLGTRSPFEQLCHMVVRGLVDPTCPWKHYLEWLHDSHNMDSEEDQLLSTDVRLSKLVDGMMDGNALVMHGVPNAPYMDKRILQQAKHRVQWVRWQQAKRELQQAVPHFAAQAAPWAISMVLSRGTYAPDQSCDSAEREVMLTPIVDLLNHSSQDPTACLRYSFPTRKATNDGKHGGTKMHHARLQQCVVTPRRYDDKDEVSELSTSAFVGVLNFNRNESHCHVITTRDMKCGDEVTIDYGYQLQQPDDEEEWKLRWGFVPKELIRSSKRRRLRT